MVRETSTKHKLTGYFVLLYAKYAESIKILVVATIYRNTET